MKPMTCLATTSAGQLKDLKTCKSCARDVRTVRVRPDEKEWSEMTLSLLLLVVAVVCFVAAFFGWARGVPAGLAAWALAAALSAGLHI